MKRWPKKFPTNASDGSVRWGDLANNHAEYDVDLAQPILSQGNAGTCWACGTSFFESEVAFGMA